MGSPSDCGIPSMDPGLPVVPAPALGELLGSWLLRVAQVYGLDVRALLSRLTAGCAPTTPAWQTWFALRPTPQQLARLAVALHRDVEFLSAMLAPRCDRRWPAELGFCARCLHEAQLDGTQLHWRRSWLHPWALACERHREWFKPVHTDQLRRIHRLRDLAALDEQTQGSCQARQSQRGRPPPVILLDGALWLHRMLTQALTGTSGLASTPWGAMPVRELAQMLRGLVHLLMSSTAATVVRDRRALGGLALPERRERWACQTCRVDDGRGGVLTLATPDALRQRQLVVGLLGHYLSLAPRQRETRTVWGGLSTSGQLAALFARELSPAQRARWPAAALLWVAPRHPPFSRQPRYTRPTSHTRVGNGGRGGLLNSLTHL